MLATSWIHVCLAVVVLRRVAAQSRSVKCFRDDGRPQRCIPEFVNAAFNKDIVANNTCGTSGPQLYCVQTGVPGVQTRCEACDAFDPKLAHPARLMTDIKEDSNRTWWQSETLLENENPVRLILNLGKTFDVTYIRIRFQRSRPQSFAIYKKTSTSPNATWIPYQFYSGSCQKTYGRPNNGRVTRIDQKVALCTDKFSGISPLSGGNVPFSTLQDRPDAYKFDSSRELQDWVTASAIRIDLDRVNTFGDEVFRDPNVLRSYYFAISDLAIGGRCKCNGHASDCYYKQEVGKEARLVCNCKHNTAGDDCEKCKPLYNDKPWARAREDDAYPCARCECNGLADACVFDENLYRSTGRGGRCINCRNNTDGINCERCRRNYYRKVKQEACRPCSCNPTGSRALQCDSDGKCFCRPGVAGEKCDRCIPGYYGFSERGCRPCQCSNAGSRSKSCDATGQCQCKANVEGKRCDQCKQGFFDLDGSSDKGCKACFCYGHSVTCEARPGIGRKLIQTEFLVGTEGWAIQDYQGNDYSSRARWYVRGPHVRVESPDGRALYFIAPPLYLGNRLSSYGKRLEFLFGVTDSSGIKGGNQDVILEGSGLRAEYPITTIGNLPAPRFQRYVLPLREPAGMSTFDFQRLLTNLTAIKFRATYARQGAGVMDVVSLESTRVVSVNSPDQVTWMEQCTCKKGYSGQQCQRCDSGFTRVSQALGPYSKCVLCSCNNHAKECDPETGACKCQDFTVGKNCEQCQPGYYGNPTKGNKDDCKPCPCIYGSQCILIGTRVKCTDCPKGHIGDRCELCDDGHFGDPLGKYGQKTRCQQCDCNGNIDLNEIGNCNTTTGECLKCVYNTQNGAKEKCELCKDGYYGDALGLPKGQCKACNCFTNGTVWPINFSPKKDLLPCDSAGQCSCRKDVIGKTCNQCPKGFWNVASGNGCERCNCDPIGSLGSECDLNSGQCKCKPGIAGRRCDRCASGHYSFSEKGCKACNCNPEGSLYLNCTEKGTCYCRPGVMGKKCDKCPENKFNLSVGCISCPPCYDLIQEEVNKLREKISQLENSTGIFNASSIRVEDKDFKEALERLLQRANVVINRTKTLAIEDNDLYQFFGSLIINFDVLKGMYQEYERNFISTEKANGTSFSDFLATEKLIEEIKRLLMNGEYLMNVEGKKAYEAAKMTAEDLSDLAKKMKKIAAEARKLADKHVADSKIIDENSSMATNATSKAYADGKKARDHQEEKNKRLKEMSELLEDALALARKTHALVNATEAEAQEAIKYAEKVRKDASSPLPDIGLNKTRETAQKLATEADKIVFESMMLLAGNKEPIKQLRMDDQEARDLMAKGYREYNISKAAYKLAKDAYERAKKAKEAAERTAREAQETLRTLKDFNEQIEKSKKNATDAMTLIPLIEKLIAEANATSDSGMKMIDQAKVNADLSMKQTDKAKNDTDKLQENIMMKKEAVEKMANDTMVLQDELKNITNEIDSVNESLTGYMKKAMDDQTLVNKTLNEATVVSKGADTLLKDLSKSLTDVDDLLADLASLGEIDLATLEDAEKRFEKARDTVMGTIEAEIQSMKVKMLNQNSTMESIYNNLDELRREINLVEQVYLSIPRQCFKKSPGVEGGGAATGK